MNTIVGTALKLMDLVTLVPIAGTSTWYLITESLWLFWRSVTRRYPIFKSNAVPKNSDRYQETNISNIYQMACPFSNGAKYVVLTEWIPIEAEAKWLPFCRPRFQMPYFYSNVTENTSHGSLMNMIHACNECVMKISCVFQWPASVLMLFSTMSLLVTLRLWLYQYTCLFAIIVSMLVLIF